MKFVIVPLFSGFIFYSCNPKPGQTISDFQNVRHEVRKTLYQYYEDIKKSGLAAEFRYLDSSSDFFWNPPGFSKSLNYKEVAEILRKNEKKFRTVNNYIDTLKVIPLAQNLASYTAGITSEITDTSGTLTRMLLLESGVMIKRADGWKLLHGQTSVVGP